MKRHILIGLILGMTLGAATAFGQIPPMPPMSTGNPQFDQMQRDMYNQQLYNYQLQQQNQQLQLYPQFPLAPALAPPTPQPQPRPRDSYIQSGPCLTEEQMLETRGLGWAQNGLEDPTTATAGKQFLQALGGLGPRESDLQQRRADYRAAMQGVCVRPDTALGSTPAASEQSRSSVKGLSVSQRAALEQGYDVLSETMTRRVEAGKMTEAQAARVLRERRDFLRINYGLELQ